MTKTQYLIFYFGTSIQSNYVNNIYIKLILMITSFYCMYLFIFSKKMTKDDSIHETVKYRANKKSIEKNKELKTESVNNPQGTYLKGWGEGFQKGIEEGIKNYEQYTQGSK